MPWTVDEQLALTATQAVDAIQSGRLKATDYVATLLARAASLEGLNSLTTLDLDGALAAAKRIDALSAADKAHLPLAGLTPPPAEFALGTVTRTGIIRFCVGTGTGLKRVRKVLLASSGDGLPCQNAVKGCVLLR